MTSKGSGAVGNPVVAVDVEEDAKARAMRAGREPATRLAAADPGAKREVNAAAVRRAAKANRFPACAGFSVG